jgi:L-iditol 2-dehydrogenase
MKALVVRAPMNYAVEDVPDPRCARDGLTVRVLACGLCGSDLRTLRSGHRKVTLPWTIGHEITGQVVEVGASYGGPWARGDVLSVAPLVYCGKCVFCRRKQYELCEGYREIAQAWPGGLAEYMAVPPEALALGTIQRVPDGLDPVHAAVAEPLSSCVHARDRGEIRRGDVVVVKGAGSIGCMHICLARGRKAGKVIVAEVNSSRLEQCGRFFPDHVVNSSEKDPVAEVRRLTDGHGADIVITANAVPETQVQAVEMAAKGGRVLLFGGLPKDKSRPGIDTNLIHYNALAVMGTTIFAPEHHKAALELLSNGTVRADLLVTHRLPLERFAEGAQAAMDGKAIKVVFTMG